MSNENTLQQDPDNNITDVEIDDTTNNNENQIKEPIDWKSKKGIILLVVIGATLLLIMLASIYSSPPEPGNTATESTESILVPGEDISVQSVEDAEQIASQVQEYMPPSFGIEDDTLPTFFSETSQFTEQQEKPDDPFAYLEETLENKQIEQTMDNSFIPITEAEKERLATLTQRRTAPSIMITSPGLEKNQPDSKQPRQNPLNPFPSANAQNIEADPEQGFEQVQSTGPDTPANTAGINRFPNVQGQPIQSNMAMYRPDQDYRLLQGTSMQMTLETAINSNLSGTVRAISNMPVYSANGKHLLIPSRSRFIGEYQSAQTGMRRLYIIWQRIITPQGIEVFLQSPGTDTIGRSGVKGKLNRRFIERFATAMIFSVINTFNRGNNTDGVSLHYSNASQTAAEIALENSVNLAPIIQIKPGALINAQAAEDINFKAALTAFANTHIQTLPNELDQYNYFNPELTHDTYLDETPFSRDEIIVELADANKEQIENNWEEKFKSDKDRPVYLIPKEILDKQRENEHAGRRIQPDPATSLAPGGAGAAPASDCAGLLLVESQRLSALIESWARRCQNRALHWTVGGADTWRDFIIEQSGFIPLPQGSDSLSTYLQSAYNINMIKTPEAIIIVENPQ